MICICLICMYMYTSSYVLIYVCINVRCFFMIYYIFSQTSKAKQAELSAKRSTAFLPDHHCTRGRSPQGKRNDSGPYMHRMMRFEPSCEKTKLHGQKDKVHDLKGTACTKLSLLLFCWPFAIWSLRISCRL